MRNLGMMTFALVHTSFQRQVQPQTKWNTFLGAIHLRAEIAFQAEISGLEFWPVFQVKFLA